MRIAIIPARGGGKRVPRKNILPFHGVPMIGHALKTLEDSKLFNRIHVSTDDLEVADTVMKLGHEIDFMRTPELADDLTPVLEVARWVLRNFESNGVSFESVCLMMPCSPLITTQDIRAAYKIFESGGGAHAVLSVCLFPAPIEWAWKTDSRNILRPAYPEYISKRSQDLPASYFDTGNFSIQNVRAVLSSSQVVTSEFIPYVLPMTRSVDIDSVEDFELAEKLFLLARSGVG